MASRKTKIVRVGEREGDGNLSPGTWDVCWPSWPKQEKGGEAGKDARSGGQAGSLK